VPIHKYRSIEEMEGNTWLEAGSPELFRAMRATWGFASRTLQPSFPPGVYRHPSIESAQEMRESWDRANFDAYQARIRSKSRSDL